ncbi:hypothetical protein [Rhizobium sp. AG855]|uniref:hypothetical protein n=1 Tax=Rhizobium sp. AG855 TaxID=2183898 RepID=UPI001FE22165|nr:hypothetical protein [Rhizobium sp. AG855]
MLAPSVQFRQLISGGNAMASISRSLTTDAADIVEKAVTRINDGAPAILDGQGEENATALLFYLVENGVRDEDELVELTLMAEGKRYDPANGTFS